MKAAIYSPYLDTLGGGERYVLSVARALIETGWNVDIESSDQNLGQKVKKRFGFDLVKANFVESVQRGNGYDLCFWLSDGSVPTLFARCNVLHFQRPFSGVDGKSLLNRMKFFRINSVVVNSVFTKKWIDTEYPKKSIVVYPPVDIDKLKAGRKENMLLYVGRFSQLEQSKGQDVLVKNFINLIEAGLRGWKLVLAGASNVGRTGFVDSLIKESVNYPITIIENAAFREIVKLYSKAKIFWSAAGYGVDEKSTPEKMEHFGISVVEAMASGAVPIIYDGGGHGEIIETGKTGYTWRKEKELLTTTLELTENKKRLGELAMYSIEASQKYSYERFKKEIINLLG